VLVEESPAGPGPPASLPPAAPAPAPRRPRWPWWTAGIVLVVGLILTGCLVFIRVPYVTIAPGSATPTEQLVSVKGAQAYDDNGDVLFTTVTIDDHVPLWRALQGWLDPTVSVRPEQVILGSRSPTEDRAFNLALMDNSKTTAIQVALEHLGYPVTAHGSLIVEIEPDTDAADALKPGDVVTSIDGKPVEFGDDLRAGIAARAPGDTVRLHINPSADGSAARDVDVKLSHQPDDPTKPMLGVQIQDYDIEFPITVDIDSGTVGGPSAGLAFTLAVLDVLTPGELTGGQEVAVTGTMDANGHVGPVGGVAQKTEAVKRSGAKVFLVPPDEYDEAKAHAGKVLEIVKVATLDDALKALASLGGNAEALPTSPSGT
jgi:PDZ domain-containing protein